MDQNIISTDEMRPSNPPLSKQLVSNKAQSLSSQQYERLCSKETLFPFPVCGVTSGWPEINLSVTLGSVSILSLETTALTGT